MPSTSSGASSPGSHAPADVTGLSSRARPSSAGDGGKAESAGCSGAGFARRAFIDEAGGVSDGDDSEDDADESASPEPVDERLRGMVVDGVECGAAGSTRTLCERVARDQLTPSLNDRARLIVQSANNVDANG
jgi:hypothetical protein